MVFATRLPIAIFCLAFATAAMIITSSSFATTDSETWQASLLID